MISVKGRWLLQYALDWRCHAILTMELSTANRCRVSSGGRLDSE